MQTKKGMIAILILLNSYLVASPLNYSVSLGVEQENMQLATDLPEVNFNIGIPYTLGHIGLNINKQLSPNIAISLNSKAQLEPVTKTSRLYLGTETQYHLNSKASLTLGLGIQHSDYKSNIENMLDAQYESDRIRYSLGLSSYITDQISATAEIFSTQYVPFLYETAFLTKLEQVEYAVQENSYFFGEVVKTGVSLNGMGLSLAYHFE